MLAFVSWHWRVILSTASVETAELSTRDPWLTAQLPDENSPWLVYEGILTKIIIRVEKFGYFV